MKLRCFLFGHVVRVRFFYAAATWERAIKGRAVTAVAVCNRCKKELSPPANPPRRTR